MSQSCQGYITRYQQKFHGIDVYGAQVTVSNQKLNGKIEEAVAADIKVQDIAEYENQAMQKQAAEQIFGPAAGKKLVSKLIVYPLQKDGKEKYVLAYYLQYLGDSSQPTAIVNSKTLQIYKQ